MVTLYVRDLDQLTMLEYLLYINGINHNIELDDGKFGVKPPYLTVYGVPLDERRAFRWIFENKEERDFG